MRIGVGSGRARRGARVLACAALLAALATGCAQSVPGTAHPEGEGPTASTGSDADAAPPTDFQEPSGRPTVTVAPDGAEPVVPGPVVPGPLSTAPPTPASPAPTAPDRSGTERDRPHTAGPTGPDRSGSDVSGSGSDRSGSGSDGSGAGSDAPRSDGSRSGSGSASGGSGSGLGSGSASGPGSGGSGSGLGSGSAAGSGSGGSGSGSGPGGSGSGSDGSGAGGAPDLPRSGEPAAPAAPATPGRAAPAVEPALLTADVLDNECLMDASGFAALLGGPVGKPAEAAVIRPDGSTTRSCYAVSRAGSPAPTAAVNVYRVNRGTPAAFVRAGAGGRPLPGVGEAAVLLDTVGGTTLQVATPRYLVTVTTVDATPSTERWAAAGRAVATAVGRR